MPGDLLLTVSIASHPYFSRRGNDLVLRLPVTLSEAALGARVDVPTPWGAINLKVPPGSTSGKRLRIKGHGVHPAKGDPGDLFAEIQVDLPDHWDEESLELIRKLGERERRNPRAGLTW